MRKKIALSRKRSKWVGQFKPEAIKGSTLHYNAAISQRYEKALRKAVLKMTKEVERELERMLKTPESKEYFAEDASIASMTRILLNKLSKKFETMFSTLSGDLAFKMVDQSEKTSSSNLKQSLGEMVGVAIDTKVKSSALKDTMKAVIANNVDLIKSIPTQYMDKVKGDVFRSITSGQGLADLVPKIKEYGQMTETRAKTIALDQTRKAYNAINAEKMKSVGVKKFEWIHSGGGRFPREDHIKMDCNTYSFDDLPIIDKRTGERGIPGQLPNCKCTMRPVITFDDDAEQ